MTLIFDARAQLAAEGKPGVHALIAGVSKYTHLPDGGGAIADETLQLAQLTGTARTADKFAKWLQTADASQLLPRRLATIRLLLSPSDSENDLIAADACTWANFSSEAKAWRKDASASNDEVTFFYFAGHGVERRKADALLLMADYGDPAVGGLLNRVVEAAELLNGMTPVGDAARQIGRTQFFFFDACRTFASDFTKYKWESVPPIWSVDAGGVDNRVAAAYYASVGGAAAYTQKEQTLFSLALFECLQRAAAIGPEGSDPRWRITTTSLIDELPRVIQIINDRLGTDQGFAPGGMPRKAPIVYLGSPPLIDVEMSVEPVTKVPNFGFEIRNRTDVSIKKVVPITPHPLKVKLPAGLYRLVAFPEPPQSPLQAISEIVAVSLPATPWVARVEQ